MSAPLTSQGSTEAVDTAQTPQGRIMLSRVQARVIHQLGYAAAILHGVAAFLCVGCVSGLPGLTAFTAEPV